MLRYADQSKKALAWLAFNAEAIKMLNWAAAKAVYKKRRG